MHIRSKSNSLFLYSIILIGIIRGLTLFFKFPSFLYKINLFNPNYFAVSNISPSMGDYLINSFFALLIIFAGFLRFRNLRIEKVNSKIISTLVIFISLLSLILFCKSILQIFTGSQYLFDLKLNTTSIGFEFKIAILGLFIIHSIIYISTQYFSLQKIRAINWKKNDIILGIAIVIIFGFVLVYFEILSGYFLCGHLLYLATVFLFKLNISIKNYHYKATIFIVVSSIFCSFIGTHTNFIQEEISDFAQKQQFAKSKLVENDPMGEFLIEVANESIKNSSAVKNMLDMPIPKYDLVDIEIKKHLKNWFDKYHIDINYYGKNGVNLKIPDSKFFEKQWAFYVENGRKTLIENLYLIPSGQIDNAKKYVYRTKIDTFDYLEIDLIIVFNALRNIADELQGHNANGRNFEYKIFLENKTKTIQNEIYSEPDDFEKKLLLDKDIYFKVFINNNIAYTALKNVEGRTVLVFSPIIPKADFLRTFSFLFILQILAFISGLILVFYFFAENNFNESYATKIQIYFGLAFLIPLFITLIIVFNLISKSHFKSEISKYEQVAFDIKRQIQQANEQYNLNFANRYVWHEIVEKLANDFNINIGIYDVKGAQITYSNIFTNSFINGNFKKGKLSVLNDLKGDENFIEKSKAELNLYILSQKIQSKNGISLGFFSIPFYPTNSFENSETNELFGSILTTFAIIFLMLFVVSIVISNRLIKPLSLITNYLQNTDLKNSSMPIEIKSKDEIGLLVQGYNKMLAKIEEGKKEISSSEKQAAWLDIAKQVAHEIKNPLTPMKLNLQHLENILQKESDIDKGKALVKISSLLFNIENISEIVDSFLVFAKMPLPKNEKIDFLKPIKNAFELYSNIDGISLKIDSKIRKAHILGDEKVLSQIVNNLIINGLQSILTNRSPKIAIDFTKVDSKYLLKISDNGSGISNELSKKVFLPNFTTKTEGSGVGLSLAKWGIENMNGEIWFESKVGEGSTFFIELPVFKD